MSNPHQIEQAILEAQHPQAIAKIAITKMAINSIRQFLACQRASIVTIERLGGRFGVESESSRGSRF